MKNVLFLDDIEERHNKALKVLFGHNVTRVYTAKQAQEAMQAKQFDVVCLDHDLAEKHYTEHLDGKIPDLADSGTEVANFMATLPAELRPHQVIIHSCNEYARNRMEDILRNAGYTYVVQKPFSNW